MNYSPEDYEVLYGQKNTSNKTEGWSMVCWLVCLILLSLILGCDGQAAEATQESIVDAQMKKQVLMEQPCTWVAQCMRIEMECPIKARRCVRGSKL